MSLAVTDLVSLALLKAHLRLSGTAEDDLLAVYLGAAVDLAERATGRALLDRDRTEKFSSWLDALVLPWAPVLSVSGITYLDSDGDSQTFTAYTVAGLNQNESRGRIIPTPSASLPGLYQEGQPGQITVSYVAGYTTSSGSVATTVPQGLRLAIMFLAAQMYEQRLPSADVEHFEVPYTLGLLLGTFKLPSF